MLFVVPQASLSWLRLFNIFINNIYLWILKRDFLNFVDISTIKESENIIEKLISNLDQENQAAVSDQNEKLIVSLDKFHAIFILKKSK